MAIKCCTRATELNVYSSCPVKQSETGTFSGAKTFTFNLPDDGYVGFSVFCSATVTSPTLGASTGIFSTLPDGRTVTNWEGKYLAPTAGQVSIVVNGGVGDYEVYFWPMKREYCVCDGTIPYKPFPANPCCEFTVDWKDGDVFWIVAFFRVLGINTINDCSIYKSDGTLVATFTAAQLPRTIQIIEDDTYTIQVKSNIGYATYFCYDCAIEPDFTTVPTSSSTYQQVVAWQNDSDNGVLIPFAERWDLEISAVPYDISIVNPYVGYNATLKTNCTGCNYDMTLFVCDTIGRIFGLKKTVNFVHAAINLGATTYNNDAALVAWILAEGFETAGGVFGGAGGCTRTDSLLSYLYLHALGTTCGNYGQKWQLVFKNFGVATNLEYLQDNPSDNPSGTYTLTFYSGGYPNPPPGTITIT